MIFAINLKALMEMKRPSRVDATPSNLDEYMRQRAENSPQGMKLLNLVAFFVLVILFRKAERRNNIASIFYMNTVILVTACYDERLELSSYFLEHDILFGDVLTV